MALLGGGAGLVPLVSVTQLVPGPDPREHRDSPLEHGDLTGQAFLMLMPRRHHRRSRRRWSVVALAGAPGVAVGVLTGVLAASGSGARRRSACAIAGPELLQLMRSGKPPAHEVPDPTPGAVCGCSSRSA